MEDYPIRTWDERIARAGELAGRYPAAAELLRFYVVVARFQQSLAATTPIESARAGQADHRSLRDVLECSEAVAAIPALLDCLAPVAPPALATAVGGLRGVTPAQWRERIDAFLSTARAGDRNDPSGFVVEAVLQPIAERAAQRSRESAERPAEAGDYDRRAHDPAGEGSDAATQGAAIAACPACGEPPMVGILREEAHGSRRSLLCGLCATEWRSPRLVCVGCGEQRFASLPVFTAEQFPHLRVDACDTCRRYLKTVDLTRDGRAVAVVDDLASVSLDLWAREQGYVRIRANLLRA